MNAILRIPKGLLLAVCLALVVFESVVSRAEPMDVRTWTNLNGQKMVARLAGFDAGLVLLRKEGESVPVRVPVSQLSEVDQKFLFFNLPLLAGEAITRTTATPQSPSASISPVMETITVSKSDRWPERFVAPDNIINAYHYPKQSTANLQVYGTTHFRYFVHINELLSPSLMKEIARVFEGVYELMSQCPFGLSAQPKDQFFIAHLHPTWESYGKAGGPRMSGGFYTSKEKEFHVPFESLGIIKKGDTWSRSQDFEVKTLVHELTHMMMHNLLPVLPMWLAEGSAEYMESIPMRSGIFQPPLVGRKLGDRRLREQYPVTYGQMLSISPWQWTQLVGGKPLTPSPPETGAPMTTSISGLTVAIGVTRTQTFVLPEAQRQAYRMSLLMTYYFMNLEGDGKGTKMKRFLEACREEAALYQDFVTNRAGGKSAYRDGTTARLHLNILLDGKDPEVVGDEIKAALSRAGIEF
jgi:hypothetical protein